MQELSTAGATLAAWKTRPGDAAVTETTAAPPGPSGPLWHFLVRPRWLGWHLLDRVSFWGNALAG